MFAQIGRFISLTIAISFSNSVVAAPQTYFETSGPYGTGYYDSSNYRVQSVEPYGDWAKLGTATMAFTIKAQSPGVAYPYYTLVISTLKLGHELLPGAYSDAQRFAFASDGHSGLDFSGGYQGFNTLTGGFTIYDATFGASGRVESFAATFYIGPIAGPIQTGKIWFNSEATISSVPEPSILWMGLVGGACLLLKRSNRRA